MTATIRTYDWTQAEERLLFVRWFVALGLLSTLVLTYPLWLTSARTFPLVPLLPAAGTFSTPLDWLALAALFLSTCWFWLSPSSVPIVIFLADALLLGLQDQNRLQSWLLSFALMMGAFLPHLRRGSRAWSALQTLRLLQGVTWATYFWSGLLKINPDYFTQIVPSVLEELTAHAPLIKIPMHGALLALPAFEVVGALLLLFRPARHVAVVMLVATNIIALTAFGPLGLLWHRSGWPWLMALALITPRLFWNSSASAREILLPPTFISKGIFLALCVVLPALGCFGRWDPHLSFGLFSGRAAVGSVVVEQSAYDELPKAIRRAATQVGEQGYYRIQLQHWSEVDTGAPPSARASVLRESAQSLCQFIAPKEPLLVGIEHPAKIPWLDSPVQEKLTCAGMRLVPHSGD
jgi:hypothetical protein